MSYLPVVVVLVGIALASTIVWTSVRVGITPMPSSALAVEAMLSMVPEDVTGSAVELGSGWGGLACRVALERPGLTVTAYELSPLPWCWAVLRSRAMGARRPRFVRRDLFEADLSEMSWVFCYLHGDAMKRLSVRLEQFSPGTVVVTNTFRLPGWEPESVVTLSDLYSTRIYRYVVPERGDLTSS
jgi:hypothetical protein